MLKKISTNSILIFLIWSFGSSANNLIAQTIQNQYQAPPNPNQSFIDVLSQTTPGPAVFNETEKGYPDFDNNHVADKKAERIRIAKNVGIALLIFILSIFFYKNFLQGNVTKEYYFKDGVQKKGPLTFNELTANNLSDDTYIWKEGMEEWAKVKDLPLINSKIRQRNPPPLPQE